MTLRINSSNKPKNWLSRREQGRMVLLIFLLGGVLFLMAQAIKPETWQWFASLGQDNREAERAKTAGNKTTDAKIDTRLAPARLRSAEVGIVTAASRADATAADERPKTRYFPGVDPNYFGSIRDNTMHRADDADAWFHLLQILDLTEQAALEKASTGHITFRQLYDQPKHYRGEIVTLAGKTRRCEKIKIANTKFGIEGDYRRIWLWPDGAANPVVIYSLGVPDGFPLGTKIDEEVEITGFFFKVWAYPTAKPTIRTAPLLLCKTIRWNESKISPERIHQPPPRAPLKHDRNHINDPRRYMDAFWRIGESQWQAFVDGRAIDTSATTDASEASTLRTLLLNLPMFPRDNLENWAQDVDLVELGESPEKYRGQIMRVDGHLEKIETLTLDAKRERLLGFKTYYRCHLRSALDERPMIVYARAIPESWKTSPEKTSPEKTTVPVAAQVSAYGFFLKAGQAIRGLPQLVFAAHRLAWHPNTILGNLGMDAGLLDTIDNRKRMVAGENECFFQMLSVVSQAKLNELSRIAIADQMRRQANNPNDKIKALEKPSGALVIHDLLSDSAKQHGRLVTLHGTVLRITPILLSDARQRRYGFEQYYEVDVAVRLKPPLMVAKKMDDGTLKNIRKNEFTTVFCIRELPAGLRPGNSLHEQVEIPAFFFKIWKVRSESTLSRNRHLFQFTPLLIGPGMKWTPADVLAQPGESELFIGLVSAGLFAITLLGIVAAMWFYRRGDKKFKQEILNRQFEVEEGTSLNDLDLGGAVLEKPDFSHLD